LPLTLKNLLEHPPWTIRIYGHQLVITPSGNHQKVRFDRTITGRKSIHRDPERHVGITTGRHPHQLIVTTQSSQGWLPADATHTWHLDPRYSPNIILVSSGCFRGKIGWP
jgi:hypothetical protein